MQAVEAFVGRGVGGGKKGREKKGELGCSWTGNVWGSREMRTHYLLGQVTNCGNSTGPGNKEVVTWDFAGYSLAV